MTSETVTDRALLQKFVEQDRERGYSVSLGERVAGGRGIGAPVLRADGYCVAAILWTCPSTRFDVSRVDEFGTAVREAASKLSHSARLFGRRRLTQAANRTTVPTVISWKASGIRSATAR